jgi:hypothetical protein
LRTQRNEKEEEIEDWKRWVYLEGEQGKRRVETSDRCIGDVVTEE